MAKRVWRTWRLKVREGQIERGADGQVQYLRPSWQTVFKLSPTEARRLFRKLSGDYRD